MLTSPDVAGAVLLAKIAQPIAVAVVQHPNFEARIVQRECGDDRPLDNVEAFVERADEDVHGRQLIGRP